MINSCSISSSNKVPPEDDFFYPPAGIKLLPFLLFNAFCSSVYHPALDLSVPNRFLVGDFGGFFLVWFFLFRVCFLCPVLTFVFCCVAHFMACYGLSGARDGLENNMLKQNEWLCIIGICVYTTVRNNFLSGCCGGPHYV